MDQWVGLVAVVTGASSGIGREIAVTLALRGMIVVAVARREELLEELASSIQGRGTIIARPADVTDEQQVQDLFQEIEQNIGIVRVLINSAGMGIGTTVSDFEVSIWEQIFQVNFFGVARCTGEVIRSARRNKPGLVQIVTINSISGHLDLPMPNFPDLSVYAFSKHAVALLSQVLVRETSNEDIRIADLSPAFVTTPIFERYGFVDSRYQNVEKMDTADIARAVITILETPPSIQITEYIVVPTNSSIFFGTGTNLAVSTSSN